MYLKWKGNTTKAREIIAEAFKFKECISNPILLELNVQLDIYDGNYQNALSNISLTDSDIIEGQYSTTTNSLQYAKIYSLMNNREKEYKYSDSARVILESEISKNPEDDRLYIAVGFAYARLGLKEKAIEAGKKAVELMPMNKEFYRGAYRVEDLSRIYVMTGEYKKALEQLKLLLSLPGPLSAKLVQLDPDWKPLRNLTEFNKIINTKTTEKL